MYVRSAIEKINEKGEGSNGGRRYFVEIAIILN